MDKNPIKTVFNVCDKLIEKRVSMKAQAAGTKSAFRLATRKYNYRPTLPVLPPALGARFTFHFNNSKGNESEMSR